MDSKNENTNLSEEELSILLKNLEDFKDDCIEIFSGSINPKNNSENQINAKEDFKHEITNITGLNLFNDNDLSNSDNRKFERKELAVNVSYKLDEDKFIDKSTDISKEGMFIKTNKLAKIGKDVVVKSYLATEHGLFPIYLKGKIVRYSEEDEKQGFGVQFYQVFSDSTETVQQVVKSAYSLENDN